MEKAKYALVDYYDAFHLYLCAIRIRSINKSEPQLSADHKDSKLDKLYEMLSVSLIGITNCLYNVGELRWGYESLNLLVYLCQNALKPGNELAAYIRDMLIHYDSHHNQLVFQLNEFERILMSGVVGTAAASSFKDTTIQQEEQTAGGANTAQSLHDKMTVGGLHDLIASYRPTLRQLEDDIRSWYTNRIKTQKDTYVKVSKTKDRKLSQSLDEEKYHLYSNSTNVSGRKMPQSFTKYNTTKTSTRTMNASGASHKGSLERSTTNDTSIEKAFLSAIEAPRSMSKDSFADKKMSYERAKAESTALFNLNEFLSTEYQNLADLTLKPRQPVNKKEAPSILKTVFPEKQEPAITDYFQKRILNDLSKDFKNSKGLEGSGEKNLQREAQESKFREKLRRAKMLSEHIKTHFVVKKLQEKLYCDEKDPFVFDPQSLKRDIKEETILQEAAALTKQSINKKKAENQKPEKDINSPLSPRNFFELEEKDTGTFSKLEQVIRKHPTIFGVGKFTAFKDSLPTTHPLYEEEREKLQNLVARQEKKDIGTRRFEAETVSFPDAAYHQER